MRNGRIDPFVFWASLVVILVATVLLVMNRKVAEPFLDDLMSSITYQMDWAFQFLTVGLFIILLWLAFSRYGKIKLGEGTPEFSSFSWGAMLFTAGMGTSIMFWSMMEPIYYYMGPPFGIKEKSVEAAEWAVTYGLFHWGLSAWALYAFPTVVIAYSYYVRKRPSLKMSVALSGALGKYADGWLAKVIDVLVIWSLVGGLGTSLGLGVPMMSAVIGDILNIPESLGLNVVIIIMITIIYSASAFLGLQKGIAKLADLNIYLALALAAFVFLVGPTLFLLSYFSNSFGLMLQNFLFMSFYTDPIQGGGFPQGWTVFYWAWFAATAPFMGLFVARISKGRTIRELITHILLWGSVGGWLYFAVFGGYSMNLELNNIVPVADILNEHGGPAAVVAILKSLPISFIVLPFFVVLGIIFLSTSMDSATYILAAIATKELREGEDPARWHRMIWGAMLAVISISLLLIGGLRVIQTSAVIVSVPIFIIYLLLIVSLFRWLKQDFPSGR
ncbi:BCCT family transporter [Sporosarcina pasteurii]|uniref:L-carnitine/gamma-butyrobetaine antiporter n=1 Tax=Sporosarcina pasteurii TaxID=1474 RepID=A0A380BIB4_SPOPA|nr:BCCT family transporter [Sporosarcina pasteurii]MDS9470691.1 BCCT family transporter [Sporosarcina pasteurii]QBQ05625.1 BCCT family transporter [Sporosarcina pasteurii]SUJ01569.1 L-carnitine/gamma-butyrobetaine antiporter [Sporosarcina pasteurii]